MCPASLFRAHHAQYPDDGIPFNYFFRQYNAQNTRLQNSLQPGLFFFEFSSLWQLKRRIAFVSSILKSILVKISYRSLFPYLSNDFSLPIVQVFPTYRRSFYRLSHEFLHLAYPAKNYGVSKTKQIDNQEKDIIADIKIPAVFGKIE